MNIRNNLSNLQDYITPSNICVIANQKKKGLEKYVKNMWRYDGQDFFQYEENYKPTSKEDQQGEDKRKENHIKIIHTQIARTEIKIKS